jgi:hypothetical protein
MWGTSLPPECLFSRPRGGRERALRALRADGPDSNRGHHDFQSEPLDPRTATKAPQIVQPLDPVAQRLARGAVARLAQPEGRLVAAVIASHMQHAGHRRPGLNSRACTTLIDTTPERPASVIQVTRRLRPRNTSRPPPSWPLVAECTNLAAPRVATCPTASLGGANTSRPPVSTSPTCPPPPRVLHRPVLRW